MCEMICSFVHLGQFQPSKARIKIYKVEPRGLDMPVIGSSCDLCRVEGYPQCVRYCPTAVLKYVPADEGKVHVLDKIRMESAQRGGGF